MADYITGFIDMFATFVKALFNLPFIGSTSYGFMLVGIYAVGIILLVLGSKMK